MSSKDQNIKKPDRKPAWYIFLVRVRRRLEGILGRGLAWVVRKQTREQAFGVADFFANFIFKSLTKVRQISLECITIAFGDKYTTEQKLEFIRMSQVYMCRTVIDFLKFNTYSDDEFFSLCTKITGHEHLENAFKKSPGGVIGITGHVGSWEYAGAWVVKSGWKVSAVGKEQRDPGVTRIMLDARTASGIKHIPASKRGNIEMIRVLKQKNTMLGLVSDQNGGWDGVYVDFFGTPASSVKGPAFLALRYNVPVIAVFALWDGDKYHIEILPEIEITRTGDMDGDVVVNTQKIQNIFQKMIEKYPDQWLWAHRRWKTRPSGEPPVHKL